VFDLDPPAPRTPGLPHQQLGALQPAASIGLHVSRVIVGCASQIRVVRSLDGGLLVTIRLAFSIG
jgi:hypothetical protein